MGYSPWGSKESDMTKVTEHMHTHTLLQRGEREQTTGSLAHSLHRGGELVPYRG